MHPCFGKNPHTNARCEVQHPELKQQHGDRWRPQGGVEGQLPPPRGTGRRSAVEVAGAAELRRAKLVWDDEERAMDADPDKNLTGEDLLHKMDKVPSHPPVSHTTTHHRKRTARTRHPFPFGAVLWCGMLLGCLALGQCDVNPQNPGSSHFSCVSPQFPVSPTHTCRLGGGLPLGPWHLHRSCCSLLLGYTLRCHRLPHLSCYNLSCCLLCRS